MNRAREPRSAARAPRQLGLLWGGVALTLIVLSPLAARIGAALPGCPLKTMVEIPCATCGTVRSAIALAALDPLSALAINPLAACAWIGLIAGGLCAGAGAIRGLGVTEPDWRLSRLWRLAAVGLVLLNWSYLIRTGA